MLAALTAAIVLGSSAAAPQPSRIVFVSSRTTVAQLYSEEPSGRGVAQLTFGLGGWSAPVPSPDGQFVAAFRGADLWLMQGDGRDAQLLATNASYALSWARDSLHLAFASAGAIWIAAADFGTARQITRGPYDSAPALSPDGRSLAFLRLGTLVVRRHGHERTVLSKVASGPAWSPDGKWIAVVAGTDSDLELVRPSGRARRIVDRSCLCVLSARAWSPDGRRLAYEDTRGLRVLRRSGGDQALLVAGPTQGFAWSPRGKAIAFATTSAVKVVTLGDRARVRTLVSFGPYEAQPGIAWSWAADLAYQTPDETPLLVNFSPSELQARVPIRQFAADGDRVAYWLCPHILGAWQPGKEPPIFLGPATLVSCRPQDETSGFGNYVYEPALAGDRLAYLTALAGNAVHERLMLTTVGRGDEGVPIAESAYYRESAPALDDVVGGGSALVYGMREESISPPAGPETIWRIDGAKPVQVTHGPDDLQPLAVDQGRIVVRRADDGSLELLGLDGSVLRRLDVSALGAALQGDDLVVLVPGEFRDYSASTGELRYVWPVPDVPSLTLDDTARGVVVYTLDGVVHLFRLSSGADVTVPGATAAKLTYAGLFYTYHGVDPWPGRIRFVPFDELPLR
jgi:Tol biopolymer transport system component